MSNEPKFTKGPWVEGRHDMATIVEGYDSKFIYTNICANGYADAKNTKAVAIAYGKDCISWEQVIANAQLIAAAPDLYEAIDKFLPKNIECDNPNIKNNEIVPLNIPYGELRALYCALKKARGEA